MCVCGSTGLCVSNSRRTLQNGIEEGMDRGSEGHPGVWAFKHSFQQHRDKLTPTGPYNRPGLTVKPWDFPSKLVFHHIDCIMERLRMIEVCVQIHPPLKTAECNP